MTATISITMTVDARGLSCPLPIVKTALAFQGSGLR